MKYKQMTNKKPWERQQELKKNNIPTQKEIYYMALQYEEPEHQALFILTYLTAGRISEIVRRNFLYKNIYKTSVEFSHKLGCDVRKIVRNNKTPVVERREKIVINYPGICKHNLEFKDVSGKPILEIGMANRKNRNFKRKYIPVPVNKEQDLLKILMDYVETLEEKQPLFNFGVSKARKLLSKTGMNPHFLRDIRLTHMVTVYDFNAFQLVKFAGWQTIAPAEYYIRISTKDLVRNF